MSTTLTRSEFAETKGWSKSYITKLVKAGRLVLTEDGRRIDVPASERMLQQSAALDREGLRRHHARRRARPPMPPPAPTAASDSYNQARAKREAALAAIAEMDLQLREASVVEMASVLAAARKLHELMQRRLEELPARVEEAWHRGNTPQQRERGFQVALHQWRTELADEVLPLNQPTEEP